MGMARSGRAAIGPFWFALAPFGCVSRPIPPKRRPRKSTCTWKRISRPTAASETGRAISVWAVSGWAVSGRAASGRAACGWAVCGQGSSGLTWSRSGLAWSGLLGLGYSVWATRSGLLGRGLLGLGELDDGNAHHREAHGGDDAQR